MASWHPTEPGPGRAHNLGTPSQARPHRVSHSTAPPHFLAFSLLASVVLALRVRLRRLDGFPRVLASCDPPQGTAQRHTASVASTTAKPCQPCQQCQHTHTHPTCGAFPFLSTATSTRSAERGNDGLPRTFQYGVPALSPAQSQGWCFPRPQVSAP